MAINTVCGFIRVASEVVDFCKESKELLERRSARSDGESVIRTINIVSRLLCLSAFGDEVKAHYEGVSSSGVLDLKKKEGLIRFIDFCARFSKAACDIENNNVFEVVEQGFFTPLASFFRAATEIEIYDNKALLEMTPEERAKQPKPIYDAGGIDDMPKVIGHKIVTEAECRDEIASAEKFDTFFKLAEAALKTRPLVPMIADSANKVFRTCQNLIETFRDLASAGNNSVDADNSFKLEDLSIIPEVLYQDHVLSNYVCPISKKLVRTPVRGPDGLIYERRAVVVALRTSGLTRNGLALQLSDFVEQPAVKAIIDARLRFHQERVNEYVELGLEMPMNAASQNAANAENPHL